MAKDFPGRIYVIRDNVGGEDYLAVTDANDVGETTDVAVYDLVEVGRMVVSRTFEPKREAKRSK